MSGFLVILFAFCIFCPQLCSPALIPMPALRIVECLKPAGRLCTCAAMPADHQLKFFSVSAASWSWSCGLQPESRVLLGSVP